MVSINSLEGDTDLIVEDVEFLVEKLHDTVFDENVEISLIRQHFTNDAWLLLMNVVKQNHVYICKCCSYDLEIVIV